MTLQVASAASRTLRTGVPLISVVIGCALIAIIASGRPAFALIPVIAAGLLWAACHGPMRWSVVGLLTLAVFADITPVDPRTNDTWVSIATPWQAALLENLNTVVGVEWLKISGMEVALFVLVVIATLRAKVHHAIDLQDRVPAPRALTVALSISFAAVLWLAVLGAARGGDLRQAFWQFRQMLWMPVIGALLCYALRGPRDFRAMLTLLTAVGCAKVAMAVYFVFRVSRPLGVEPPTATSHTDTVLYVVVLAIWAALVIDRPSVGRVLLGAIIWGWILFGIVLNHRRTAFVSLAATMLLLLAGLSGRARRRAFIAFVASLPLLLPYLALARHRPTGIFGPGNKLVSAIEQKDGSSATRDIENFNLIVTAKQHRVIGTGWGHEYVEQIKGEDISKFFPQYRYIAHNSVLWLLSIGGFVGFTLLWLPIVVGVYFAARGKAFARTQEERVAAYAVLAIVASFLLQAWADMGVVSWTSSGLLACALVVGGKLAVANGGWTTHLSPAGRASAS